MPFTNYFDQKLIQLGIGQVGYTIPTILYTGLSSTAPSQIQAGSPNWNFNEPSGNAYARVGVNNNTTNWGPASPLPATGYAIQNLTVITYQQSSAAWAAGQNLGWFGLFDALTGGNLLVFGICSPAQAVGAANITLSFAIGAMYAAIN